MDVEGIIHVYPDVPIGCFPILRKDMNIEAMEVVFWFPLISVL